MLNPFLFSLVFPKTRILKMRMPVYENSDTTTFGLVVHMIEMLHLINSS